MFSLILLACTSPDGDSSDSPADTSLLDFGEHFAGTTIGGDPFVVTVLVADPDPPDVGENTWTLSVEGADTLRVTPYMPQHQHGTTPPWFDGEPAESGFVIGPMPLPMAGQWDFTLSAGFGEASQELAFTIWIEG